jgi:multiple sugar transport system permease protein
MIRTRRGRSVFKAYLFLAPFLVLFAFVVVYPIIFGVRLSLYGQRGARMWYVGLSNYRTILGDPRFWEAFKIPLFLLLVQVPLMIFLAILIAFVYERMPRGRAAFHRFIHYLPYTIPAIVAGIVWSYIFSDSMSPLRPLLDLLGFAGVRILNREHVPLVLLVIIFWEFTGYTAFVVFSALLAVPREYAEQAQIDGATFWQTAFFIKLPLVRGVITMLFIFNAIGALQVFNEPWMLGALVVLPPNYTPAMYIYNSAFAYGRFTYATAMGLVLACITFLISLYVLRMASRQLLARGW